MNRNARSACPFLQRNESYALPWGNPKAQQHKNVLIKPECRLATLCDLSSKINRFVHDGKFIITFLQQMRLSS